MEANLFVTIMFVAICLIERLNCLHSLSSTQLQTTTPIDATSNLIQIKHLLSNCSVPAAAELSKEQCDVCSLCQNEAFCRQTKNLKPKHAKPSAAVVDLLAALRDLVDFSCYCVPGYTGTFCQIDINECLSTPCSNNATCIDQVNAFECSCPAGFKGESCQVNIDDCESTPCLHGSKCVDLVDGFRCECLPGFMGSECEQDINECESQPCGNNATCLNLLNKFECNCSGTGFSGTRCEVNIDDCLIANCQHNSTCIDGVNTFHCNCPAGFTGRQCEIDIDECLSSLCKFGQCWQNSDPHSFLKRIEHIGSIIQPSNLLQYSPASSTANDTTLNNQIDVSLEYRFSYLQAAGYWCECTPGYTGPNCETKINECESNPCGFNGKCLDLVNEFKCECYSGYSGLTCQENINECDEMSPCAPFTKCIDLHPDYTTLTPSLGYQCDCSELNEELFKTNRNQHISWSGSNCTLKLNACQTYSHLCQHNSECQSVLVNTQQDIKCECQPGWTGKYCQIMTTIHLDGSYSPHFTVANGPNFLLKLGFRIQSSQNVMPLLFLEHSAALLFEIKIHRKYLSITNSQIDLNEKIAFYENSAEWHSIELTRNAETDLFNVVYSVPSLHLIQNKTINHVFNLMPNSVQFGKLFENESLYLNSACVRDVMLNDAQMFLSSSQNKMIKFGCEVSRMNEYNETSFESKAAEPITCQDATDYACFNNGTCATNSDGFFCSCSKYFTGSRCEIFDPCLSHMCSVNSVCRPNKKLNIYSAENQFECLCNEGFMGLYCTIRVSDTCLAKPCLNNGACSNLTAPDQPNKLTYHCNCANGYEGKNCQYQTDFCKVNNPCNNGASCKNLNPSVSLLPYQCSCSKGWKGHNCTEDVDECDLMKSKSISPCTGNGRCFNTKGDYKCICNHFHYGKNCQMTHVCKQQQHHSQNPCENEATCLMNGNVNENKYICKCAYGYTGVNCSYPTCDLQLCQHDSVCEMINSTNFECNCNGTGHVGPYCQHLVNETECHMLACINNTCDPNNCDCKTINCDLYLAKQSKPNQVMYHLVLWPLVGIMFGLLCLLFGIFVMKMRKNKATHGTYSPSRHELQASRIGFNMDFKRPPEERLI